MGKRIGPVRRGAVAAMRTTKTAAESAREYIHRFQKFAERNIRNRIEQASQPATEKYWRDVHAELRKILDATGSEE